MLVVILHYTCCCVEAVTIPNHVSSQILCGQTTIEDYLEKLGYNIDEISYMCADDEIPLYDGSEDSDNVEEPIYVIREIPQIK